MDMVIADGYGDVDRGGWGSCTGSGCPRGKQQRSDYPRITTWLAGVRAGKVYIIQVDQPRADLCCGYHHHQQAKNKGGLDVSRVTLSPRKKVGHRYRSYDWSASSNDKQLVGTRSPPTSILSLSGGGRGRHPHHLRQGYDHNPSDLFLRSDSPLLILSSLSFSLFSTHPSWGWLFSGVTS